MPPVLGPVSPSPTRLWSCAAASGSAFVAVDQREKARLLAGEEFLDDDLGPGRAEAALRRAPHRPRACASATVGGDDDALAGGQPVGLDDDRRALRGDIGLRRGGVGEAAIGGGRDALAGAEVLHEALRAFERGGRGVGPNAAMPAASSASTRPRDQRRLRPDDDEIDPLAPAERDERRRCRSAAIAHAFGLLGDAGIARRAIEPVDQRRGGDRPAQRVLAPARADDQDPHSVTLARCKDHLRCEGGATELSAVLASRSSALLG